MRPLLLATDGSPAARAAAREAIALAAGLGCPLHVVCVAEDLTPAFGGYFGYTETVAALRRAQARRVTEILSSVEVAAAEAGDETTTERLDGRPGPRICAEARRRNAQLLAVGARNRGRLASALRESAAAYVLQHAYIPVLVVAAAAS